MFFLCILPARPPSQSVSNLTLPSQLGEGWGARPYFVHLSWTCDNCFFWHRNNKARNLCRLFRKLSKGSKEMQHHRWQIFWVENSTLTWHFFRSRKTVRLRLEVSAALSSGLLSFQATDFTRSFRPLIIIVIITNTLATPNEVAVDNLWLLMNVPDFKFSPLFATTPPSGPTKTRTTSERVPADLTTRRRNCHLTGAHPSRRFASVWGWEARQGSLWSKSRQARCTLSLLMEVTEVPHLDETPGKASSGDRPCNGTVGKKVSTL